MTCEQEQFVSGGVADRNTGATVTSERWTTLKQKKTIIMITIIFILAIEVIDMNKI